MKTRPQRLLAYALITIGVIMLLSRIGGADWLWLALISAIFLVGYVSRQNYNFLVAGGVLMGIAVGTLIGTDSGMLLSLAAGFFAIDRTEPKPNRWALYSAGIFAVLGALVALGSFGLLGSVAFALVLVAAGAYLLYREGNTDTPETPASGSYTPAQTPVQTASPAFSDGTDGAPTPASESAPPFTPAAEPERVAQTDTPTHTEAPAVAAQPQPQTALSVEADTRLKRLEAWRRETAKAEGVPAYIVFTNDTLTQLAAANPQTLGELGTVKGVGPIKRSRYGETVLSVLRGDREPDGDKNSDPESAAS